MTRVAPTRPVPGGPLRRSRRSTLAARLSRLTFASGLACVLVFAAAAFAVIAIDEKSEDPALTNAEVDSEAAREVVVALAIAAPFAVLIAVVGSSWIGRRVLGPIEEVIDAAQRASAESLGARLSVPSADDELRALVLAQNKLFERLETGFSALSRFAADASHELRTPLATVVNDLEVSLRRPRTPEEWTGTAERALEELHRLNRVIDALLQLARADGPPNLATRTVLAPLLERLAARFGGRASGRRLTVEMGPQLEQSVEISEDALGVVLTNLLTNAVRHASSCVCVSVSPDHDGDRIWIHMDDDGPGVPEGERETIFLPFRRGPAAADDAGQLMVSSSGVGLGLTIARRFVERHGGNLRVGKSPLGGARFSVGLPVASDAPPRDLGRATSPGLASSGRRVLH